jgi:hypothetical protein
VEDLASSAIEGIAIADEGQAGRAGVTPVEEIAEICGGLLQYAQVRQRLNRTTPFEN